MTTGAEPKKIAILVGLLAVAGIALYLNVFSGDSGSGPAPVKSLPATTDTPIIVPRAAPKTAASRRQTSTVSNEFKPRQGFERPEDRPDPASIDPTLRLDLLAKVQNVEPGDSLRNIFQYGSATPPPSAKPIVLPKNVAQIAINKLPAGLTPPKPGAPSASGAPPMTFKYYGYRISKASGHKEAFLLDGDDIIVTQENANVKNRYKVVSIGLTSITIEDTQFKQTQTLRIQEEPNG